MALIDTILKLSALKGPAGFEAEAETAIKALLAPFMDDVITDTLGNIIGTRRCGRDGAPKLMLDAHFDEIGFIITGAEEGFLRFAPLGGVDARMLPASELVVLTEPPVIGVVTALPPHLLKGEEGDKTIKIEDLYLDVGLTAEEALQKVPLGTPAVYAAEARRFGDDLVCGKSLDNRVSVAAVLRALELIGQTPLDVDLIVLFSVQEEVGTRGAKPGAYAAFPDWCIVIDVGHAKTPDCKTPETKEQGSGVVISKGPNMNRRLAEKLQALAEAKNIHYQIGVEPDGDSGTNARVVQVTRAGVATALVGVPLKYMHSSHEVISVQDAEATAALLCEIAKALKGDDRHA
ncbi:M20/M25/M40 family metallo-hydrolase [Oscillospiraceae bacterium WX1]